MADFTIDQINKRIAADPDMQKLHTDDPNEFDDQVTQMYDHFGYNSDGSPLSKATKVAKGVEDVTGISRTALKSAAAMGVSAATTVGGSMIGAPLGPSGVVGGAMVGSLAGERANTALGLSDESTPTSDAIALAAPLAGPLVAGGLKSLGAGMKRIPGIGATLHSTASDNLEQTLSRMRVTPDMVDGFSDILNRVKDFKVKTPLTRQAVKDELNREAQSKLPNQPYIDKLNDLMVALPENGYSSFKSLMATEKSFNDLKEAAPTAVWKKLSGVLINDLQTQANNPAVTQASRDKIAEGANAYTNLIRANRKMHAGQALDNLMKASVTEVNGDPHLQKFNMAAFMKKLKYDPAFQTDEKGSTFSAQDIADMKETVQKVGYLGWAPSGGQSAQQYIGRSGAAGTAGFLVGGSKGAAITFAAAAAISHAFESSWGRSIVKYLAKEGQGKVDMLQLQTMLGKAVAGASSAGVAGINSTIQNNNQTSMPQQD